MATDSELKAQKLEMARKANADLNKRRLEMLEQIADGSDEAHAGEMQEQDGDKIILSEPGNKLETKEDDQQNTAEQTTETTESTETTVEQTASDEQKTDTTAESTEATQQANGEDKTETQEEDLPTDERVVNGTRYYLTIVNGKEKWLTKNQLIEKAQKVESADEYLQNAAEAVRSTVRTDPSETDDTVSVEDDDMEKTLNSAVLGDQEAVKKVASALADLRKQLKEAKQSQPSVSQDVVKEIDNRLAFRNAVEWFEGEYSKELSDPKLKKLIYDKDLELAQANPTMPFKERLKKAGDEVRNWINGQKGVQAKPSLEKIERKKTHVNVPAASQRQTVTTEDDEEESVESIIQQMAKGRGQLRAIVHKGRS